MSSPDEEVELAVPPAFEVGQKVRARTMVRNDGTFFGQNRGTLLIEEGEVGYVNSIGDFLQRYYIYAVDFYERGCLVGMRAHELEAVDEHSVT